MTKSKPFTNIRSLLGSLGKALNLVNHEVEHHHEQTAYLTYGMCRYGIHMDEEESLTAMYAALLHDVGSVVIDRPAHLHEIEANAFAIAQKSRQMLADIDGFEEIAEIIGYCQCNWEDLLPHYETGDKEQQRVLRIANVIHLADVVSISLDASKSVLNQAKAIREFVRNDAGKYFCPEAVRAFLEISELEYVWLDTLVNPQFLMYFTGEIGLVSLEETVHMTQLISHIIDYRSPFTAMHSAGVSACATKLAELCGMSREECMMMEIAGNVHDIGKLVVPRSILEKPGKLTEEEFNVMKEHAYYTRYVLMDVPGFERIANWAGFHHEKLNGTGYPFHFSADQLDLGSRIMAVADVFSAVAEERPYRKPMTLEQAIAVLREDMNRGYLDAEVVRMLIDHCDEVNAARDARSHDAGKRYFASLAKQDE